MSKLDEPKRLWSWTAHLHNYAELYERARITPVPTKKGMNTKQRAKARAERAARLEQHGREK
jgi:hypothetical protein